MTDPRTIPETEINQHLIDAMSFRQIDKRLYVMGGDIAVHVGEFNPLQHRGQLMQLWLDNWDDVCNVLANWLYGWEDRRGKEPDGEIEEYSWWENPEFKENKPLWILRALVASRQE